MTIGSANPTPTTYTVTYKPGTYGSGTATTATKTKGQALTLKGAVFTRTGYTQTGWAKTDGGAKAYSLGGSYTTDAAITLYPYWTANSTTTYTITYKPGDYSSGSTYTATKTKGAALTLRGSTYSRSGYTQAGWSTSAAGTVKNYNLNGTYTADAMATLYPYWTAAGKPNLLFSKNTTATSAWPQSVYLGASSSTTTKATTFNEGSSVYLYCSFLNDGSVAIDKSFAVLHQILNSSSTVVKSVTTTFDSLAVDKGKYWNGSALSILQGLSAGSYTYKCTLDSGSAVAESSESDNVATYAFTVKSTKRYVTVTWDANGGQFAAGVTTSGASYDASSTFGTLETPTRSGYAFAGWYTQQSGGTKITSSTTVSSVVSSTATSARFYAHWTAVGKPNLAFVRYGDASSWPQAVFLGSSASSAAKSAVFNAGATIYLYNCFINNGAVATGGGFKILHEVLDSSSRVVSSAVTNESDLNAGGSRWFNGMGISPLQGLTAGSYTYRCTLDSDGVIGESNESDNVATFAFTVKSADGSLVCGEGRTDFGEHTMPFVVSGTCERSDETFSFTFVPTASSEQSVWFDSAENAGWYLEATLTGNGKSVTLTKTETARHTFVKGATYTVSFEGQRYSSANGDYSLPFKMQFGGTTPTIPYVGRPTSVTATAAGSGISVSWTAVSGATKYYVYRNWVSGKTGAPYFGSKIAEVSSGTTTYADASAQDGTEYWYYVRAANGDTVGRYSEKSNLAKSTEAGGATTVALARGWTWISVPVTPADATFASVFKGVSFADEDVVKSSDGSATYYSGTWYPSPSTFKLVAGRAYAVKKSTAGSVSVTVKGAAAPTSLAVVAGWNWIGPLSDAAMPLSSLTHSGGFVNDDVINSSSGSATYYGGTWYGDLKSLEPGVGYKAKFGKAGALSKSR